MDTAAPPKHAMNFETITQASAALALDVRLFHAARDLGCTAFRHGRVRGAELIDYLAANLRAVNAQAVDGGWYGSPPTRLSPPIIARLRRTLAKLDATAAPEKRHVGRAIAAAVRRELTDATARQIAGMDPEAAVATLAQLRERILAA